MPKFLKKSKDGLTLIELMTVLIIIMLLAMVGFPTYQEYQNRANLAEAETTMGTMERHLRTYFLDHGSFYSAAPTPATVPGLASLGDSSAFTTSGGWAAIGSPVANGAAVNFSYQAFAGQTPNGSTTPVVNAYLNDPTANMNLIRRTSTAYNYHFPQSAGIASSEEKLRLDWSDFGFCASAAEDESQIKNRCDTRCKSNGDYQGCMDLCTGEKDDVSCVKGCEQSGIGSDTCNDKCSKDPADGKCTSPADIDCYPSENSGGKTAAQNCQSACEASGGKPDKCGVACGEESDTKCDTENIADIDCYHDDKKSTGNSAHENCIQGCIEQNGGDASYADKCGIACEEESDGECNSKNAADIDCYSDDSAECMDKCMESETGDKADCSKKCDEVKKDKKSVLECIDPDNCGGGNGGGNAGGGSGGGGEAGGGSGADAGQNSGEVAGEAGGGSGSGDGSESGNEGATSSQSSAECASFGINKPTDLGIQTNVQGYNWVAMTAVGNFSPGSECTLVAKLIQVVGGQMSQTDFIKINVGE